MAFWPTYSFHARSAIDGILEQESFSLEDLLEEDDVLQETKSQNRKLIEFLTRPTTLNKLLQFVNRQNVPEGKEKKYPHLATEILCCDTYAIVDCFFQNQQDGLAQLFSILDAPGPIAAPIASSFAKIAAHLLQRRGREVVGFVIKKENLLRSFVGHIDSLPISDLFLKLVAIEDPYQSEDIFTWFADNQLGKLLVGLFGSPDPELLENLSHVYLEVCEVSSTTRTGAAVLAQLNSEESIRKLFEHGLSNGAQSPALLYTLPVLTSAIKRAASEFVQTTDSAENLPTIFQILVENLGKLKEILTAETVDPVNMTFGQLKPLGFHRLKAVEFVSAIVSIKNPQINKMLVEQNIFSTCLDLFFQYQWNNFLHQTVNEILATALKGFDNALKLALFEQLRLHERVAQANLPAPGEDDSRNKRPGFAGFLTQLSETIEAAASDPEINRILEGSSVWKSYFEGELQSIRQVESQMIGGGIEAPVIDREASIQQILSQIPINFFIQKTFQNHGSARSLIEDDEEEDEAIDEDDLEVEIEKDELANEKVSNAEEHIETVEEQDEY